MKLIFVLILIIGIAVWYFKPSKPQDASSKKQTTVQTNNTTSAPRSTGKSIWDGKLTVDENTVDELLDRPHNELSAEEVALKCHIALDILPKTKDWTKYLECLTDQLRQRLVNDIKKYGDKIVDKIGGDGSMMLINTAVASVERENSAKVMVVFYNSLKPKNDGTRVAYIYDLYKTKLGWVTDMAPDELATERTININGKYYARFLFTVRPDGTIAMATPIIKDPKTGKTRSSSRIDLTDQHITVDDLMEGLMK